jgi:hypothetical protein
VPVDDWRVVQKIQNSLADAVDGTHMAEHLRVISKQLHIAGV